MHRVTEMTENKREIRNKKLKGLRPKMRFSKLGQNNSASKIEEKKPTFSFRVTNLIHEMSTKCDSRMRPQG